MPGLAVIVAIIQNEKVLLTKREDFEVWCLPGGSIEDGESLAEAGVREVKEETGLEVELTSLVGVYSRLGGGLSDVHAVLFRAKPIGGELRLQPSETIEAAWFTLEAVPDEVLFGHKQRIADAFNNRGSIAMRQELQIPNEKKHTRKELYALRDKSGLSRQQFYLQRIARAEIKEVVEVGGV